MDKQEFAEYVAMRYDQDPNGRFDRFGKEYIKNTLPIRVVYDDESDLSWVETNLGTSFGSKVDYGDTYQDLQAGVMSEAELKQEVRDRVLRSPRQINFVNKNGREIQEVYTGLLVNVRKNGYSIYPDKENTVQM